MNVESEDALTHEFLRKQLRTMADMRLSEQKAEMVNLFAGLVATMNMLQPEGYPQAVPAFIFHPLKG
jgi:hypothetical protein